MSLTKPKVKQATKKVAKVGKFRGQWDRLNEYIIIEIFDALLLSDLHSAALSCKRWFVVAKSDILWKRRLIREYHINPWAGLSQDCKSWMKEYRRLYWQTPAILAEEICDHSEEIIHATFSPEGDIFATVGADCSLFVYSTSGMGHSKDTLTFAIK